MLYNCKKYWNYTNYARELFIIFFIHRDTILNLTYLKDLHCTPRASIEMRKIRPTDFYIAKHVALIPVAKAIIGINLLFAELDIGIIYASTQEPRDGRRASSVARHVLTF